MMSLFCLGFSSRPEPVRPHATEPRTAARDKLSEGIILDCPTARRILTPTGPVTLSPPEWALLFALMATPGVTMRRADLLSNVWGADYPGTPRVVDVRVGHLRRKLDITGGCSIETVYGSGYRFVPAAEARP
jgi:DNA-binding response OmpR family regulator